MPRPVAANATRLKRHPKCSTLFHSNAKRVSEGSSSRSSSSTGRLSAVAAPSVAYLANMTIEVTRKSLAGGPQFAITVHDRKSSSTWRHLRSYNECRGFQRRLLGELQRGHLCFAECPWLFTFLKRVFPKPRLFNFASPKVVEARRLALARFFLTLQAVLVNPVNQSCSVLTTRVANAVVGFLTNHGASEPLAPWQQLSPAAIRPMARTFSESFLSLSEDDSPPFDDDLEQSDAFGDGDELEGEVLEGGERFCCAMCALHATNSDEQVFASWQASSRLPALLAPTKTVALSPLDETAVLGNRLSDGFTVMQHDGTPKEPYPFADIASPSGSSVYDEAVEIDLSLTGESLAVEFPVEPKCATDVKTKLAVLPRRSLRALQHMTHVIRHKLVSPHAA